MGRAFVASRATVTTGRTDSCFKPRSGNNELPVLALTARPNSNGAIIAQATSRAVENLMLCDGMGSRQQIP